MGVMCTAFAAGLLQFGACPLPQGVARCPFHQAGLGCAVLGGPFCVRRWLSSVLCCGCTGAAVGSHRRQWLCGE
jgi:hypothetical protein